MRYVVIGAGAIGGTIGGRLHEAGREVVLLARGRHLVALREHGLRLDEPGRSRTLRIPAVGAPHEVDWRADDVVVMATKTQDGPAALDAVAAVAPHVPVVCAQNGVANERFAAARFAQVVAMCVMLPAEHLEPGVVTAYSSPVPGILDVGGYPTGRDALTDTIADDLVAAGFSARSLPEVMAVKYRKLLGNLGNAAEAACGNADPDLLALADAAYAEGEHCLRAAGIAVVSAAQDAARRGDLISMRPVNGRDRLGGSTWQSLQRRAGSTEADHLNGEIVALGVRHGVPTPVNAALLHLVDRMAAAGEEPGSRSAADVIAAVR
jgi:2-dehydropantoate 2-reductase